MTSVYNRPDGKNRFQIASASERPLFSAWLDQEFNDIYKDLNSLVVSQTVSASEWTLIPGTYTQASTTSFTVEGDLSGVFEALRAIKFVDSTNVSYYTYIQSSSYDSGTGITTVVVYGPVVPATISSVGVGIISEESATIPSSHTVIKTNNYTVGAKDKIILVNDEMSYTGTLIYDDGQVGGDGYPALLITLPQPSVLPQKLLCVKKFNGNYKTIVSSAFTHSTSLNDDNETVHTNTYDFQILGDSAAKNRVTLEGVGDCYWLVSDGTNWYELTPEASESVKGIVRMATDAEMTLTAEQIADNEELSKTLAVSPYNLEKNYLRTDASNMRFASNYIYTAPNGVAALVNNNIVVYEGLGLNIPTGRDDNGVITTKKLELNQNLTFSPVEVTDKLKLMFVKSDQTLQPILAENYYMGYKTPTVTGTQLGDVIIWFDFSANLLKQSTDNGSNWTTFDGSGPICEFYGNGVNITNITPYASVGFLTRDELQNVYQTSLNNGMPDSSAAVSKTLGTSYTAECNGYVLISIDAQTGAVFTWNGTSYTLTTFDDSAPQDVTVWWPISKGDTYSFSNDSIVNRYIFYPCKGALK